MASSGRVASPPNAREAVAPASLVSEIPSGSRRSVTVPLRTLAKRAVVDGSARWSPRARDACVSREAWPLWSTFEAGLEHPCLRTAPVAADQGSGAPRGEQEGGSGLLERALGSLLRGHHDDRSGVALCAGEQQRARAISTPASVTARACVGSGRSGGRVRALRALRGSCQHRRICTTSRSRAAPAPPVMVSATVGIADRGEDAGSARSERDGRVAVGRYLGQVDWT